MSSVADWPARRAAVISPAVTNLPVDGTYDSVLVVVPEKIDPPLPKAGTLSPPAIKTKETLDWLDRYMGPVH